MSRSCQNFGTTHSELQLRDTKSLIVASGNYEIICEKILWVFKVRNEWFYTSYSDYDRSASYSKYYEKSAITV